MTIGQEEGARRDPNPRRVSSSCIGHAAGHTVGRAVGGAVHTNISGGNVSFVRVASSLPFRCEGGLQDKGAGGGGGTSVLKRGGQRGSSTDSL